MSVTHVCGETGINKKTMLMKGVVLAPCTPVTHVELTLSTVMNRAPRLPLNELPVVHKIRHDLPFRDVLLVQTSTRRRRTHLDLAEILQIRDAVRMLHT